MTDATDANPAARKPWKAVNWSEIRDEWYELAEGIVCACGEQIVVSVDDGQKRCECGRTYRLVCRLQMREP